MKGLIQTKSVKVYTASDGKVFDSKAEAEKHQARLSLANWFKADVDDATANNLVRSITDDLDGFREVIAPLIRKPRSPKAVEPAEATAPAKGRRAA